MYLSWKAVIRETEILSLLMNPRILHLVLLQQIHTLQAELTVTFSVLNDASIDEWIETEDLVCKRSEFTAVCLYNLYNL